MNGVINQKLLRLLKMKLEEEFTCPKCEKVMSEVIIAYVNRLMLKKFLCPHCGHILEIEDETG